MSVESGQIEREDVSSIIEEIDKLSSPKKIALRRCCGKLLKDASAEAIMAFYQIYSLPEKFDWTRDRLFAAACMYCLWDMKDREKANIVPIEELLYKKRKKLEEKDSGGWSGMERRLLRLLDRKWDKDGLLCIDLWRIIKQMKKEDQDTIIDMVSLGFDLCYWNTENRTVQQRWLQVCYQEKKEEKENVD